MKVKKFNENIDDKPRLKMEMVSMIKVDYDDLEDFIKEVYGFTYETVAEEEWNNDSNYEFRVNDNMAGNVIPVSKIRNGYFPGSFSLGLILNMLCDDGLIPSGNYTISVCW